MADEQQYILTSLSKALEILDLLNERGKLKASEIGNALNINKSSIFKMLYTLERYKYVLKMDDGCYALGIKFALYSSNVSKQESLLAIAKPYLEKLRDDCNETVHLGILDDDLSVIFIAKETSNASIHMTSRVGIKMPFYLTALGKVLTANNLDEQMLARIKKYELRRCTENTITDYDALIKRLNETRDQGFGSDLEENEAGLISFSAPVTDVHGKTIAAISISGPAYRMLNSKESLIAMVKKAAKNVSDAISK